MVPESISLSGSNREENIYNLMMRLHCLCISYRCHIIFIHVSGTRMIGQGTDGLFRGSLYNRVMKVKPMLFFMPLRELLLESLESLGLYLDQWASELRRSVDT